MTVDLRKANFQDKQLVCLECEAPFTFTKGEQCFYAAKGLSTPKRCPECRQRRRATLVPDPEVQR